MIDVRELEIGKQYNIPLKEEHVLNGHRASARSCPVALALKEYFGISSYPKPRQMDLAVGLGWGDVYDTRGNRVLSFSLDNRTFDFILEFDRGKWVELKEVALTPTWKGEKQ